jgi:eukaryotic-like serine/threonine-protein kinase
MRFSPDGKTILLFRSGENNKRESWLLPYPAGGRPPRLVVPNLAPLEMPPSFGWMPDSRHIVVAMSNEANYGPTHLWMADVQSNELNSLTNGTTDEYRPAIAPDGKSLLLTQISENVDIVSLSVLDGSEKTLISTGHVDGMASWSAKQEKLVWVTNRSGPWEIWLRSPDGSDRPVITDRDFPGEPTRRFITPSISPNGDRVIFTRVEGSGKIRLWISSLSGGSPVRLTNRVSGEEFGGLVAGWQPVRLLPVWRRQRIVDDREARWGCPACHS